MQGVGLKLSRLIRARLESDQGQDAVEYVLIVAILALGITLGMRGVALELQNAFTQIATTISNVLENGSGGSGGGQGNGGGQGGGGGKGDGGGNGGGQGNGGGKGKGK